MIAVYRYITDRFSVFVLILSVVLLISSPALATEENQMAESSDDTGMNLTFELMKRDYEYKMGNRPDPFIPFYTGEKTAGPEIDPNEIVEVEQKLTGMQLFEPGQLKLVALLKVKGAFFAMVEDFKGQGYVIKEGTKIGRRGVVKDIQKNKVVIEEVAVTRAGKELRSEIVMALRKEGEE